MCPETFSGRDRPRPNAPMKLADRTLLVILISSAIVYFPFSQWISTARIGTTFFLWGQLIYLVPLLAAVLALPVLVICLFFRRTRRLSFVFLMVSALYISSCIGGIILGHKTRMAGMRSFAQRSQFLINAISSYERDHSAPPHSLEDLVPEYLPAVPNTDMMAYPEYCYHAGNEAREHYADNPWALSVFTPGGGINFDMMLYFPKQNYPDRAYGGRLERIDDWAYVHE